MCFLPDDDPPKRGEHFGHGIQVVFAAGKLAMEQGLSVSVKEIPDVDCSVKQDPDTYYRNLNVFNAVDEVDFILWRAEKAFAFAQTTEDQREAFDAFYECYGDDDMAHFEERFKGSYDSEEDFAQEIISECYDLDRMMGSLSSYFDYEAYARDLFMTDFTFWDGYDIG